MLENRSDNFTEDTADAGLADNALPSEAMEDLDGDGVMDFTGPDYRYYAFETPFVSNLDNSKKLITLELSLLIKRPAFFVDGALEDLMKTLACHALTHFGISGYPLTRRAENTRGQRGAGGKYSPSS